MPLPVLRERRHEGVASRLVVKKTEHATFAGPSKASTPLIQHGDRRTARRRAGSRTCARSLHHRRQGISIRRDRAVSRALQCCSGTWSAAVRSRQAWARPAFWRLRCHRQVSSARSTRARSASYLALLCEQGAEAALILDRYGAGSAARTKTSGEADARTLKRLIYATPGRTKDEEWLQDRRHRHPCEPKLRDAGQVSRPRRPLARRRAPALRAREAIGARRPRAS